MTTDEWRAQVAAARPPLSPEQLAILRPIFRPVIRRMQNAAPGATGTALTTASQEGGITSARS